MCPILRENAKVWERRSQLRRLAYAKPILLTTGPNQERLHSDRGCLVTAKPVAQLLADLSLVWSLARPRTPDDNRFSEAQFKTVKYHYALHRSSSA